MLGFTYFYPVRSRAEVQTLKDAVEIIDLTREVTVDIDRGFSWRDLILSAPSAAALKSSSEYPPNHGSSYPP